MSEPATYPDVEITPEMIRAGAAVLWEDESLDIGPAGAAILAEAVLAAALKARRRDP